MTKKTYLKSKKITVVDVDIEPNSRIYGDDKSVIFGWYADGTEKDNEFEMSWEEVYKACMEYIDSKK